ncbi:hypothetical protein CesoFtcFv8_001526 [Champsocephalus esox]|uniref:Uncharacterized protein n=1 Tax=Champsocephalus esox TaxID=159716 RepID=A0AAN8HHX7_9TELE|nr:hypothetical protein CesoFtcFv8_001526 [Champsocephalus esox]
MLLLACCLQGAVWGRLGLKSACWAYCAGGAGGCACGGQVVCCMLSLRWLSPMSPGGLNVGMEGVVGPVSWGFLWLCGLGVMWVASCHVCGGVGGCGWSLCEGGGALVGRVVGEWCSWSGLVVCGCWGVSV